LLPSLGHTREGDVLQLSDLQGLPEYQLHKYV
jgi:hypothetical protein